MKYLLDTNVLSELIRKEPDPRVLRWVNECDESALFLSVITLGELEKGIKKLNDEGRAERLRKWVNEDLAKRFEGRILPIDLDIAITWGRIQGASEKGGTKLPVLDSLIAATAIVNDLTVATRNTHDLERCRASVLNPWQE